MNRPIVILLAAVAAIGSWYFFNQAPIHVSSPRRDQAAQTTAVKSPTAPPVIRPTNSSAGATIHIATFDLEGYGITKMQKSHVMDLLARIIQHFDLVAVQSIQSRDEGAIPALVDHVNQSGRRYDHVIGPRVGDGKQKEQFAFIFNRAAIEVDRYQLYTIDDPHNLIRRDPFVGWFRARGPEANTAFTFSLVNVHTDVERPEGEDALLGQVLREVRNDGRNEDDVIVMGNFNLSAQHIENLSMLAADTEWALSDSTSTNTRDDLQSDNIFFNRTFTDEFTGRSGVFDVLRQFNLTMEQALEVSNHKPVWAEFSVFEGNPPGRVATRPTKSRD